MTRVTNLLDVFLAGRGAQIYRIPALAVTEAGTLLAFAEARRAGIGDTGDIDLVVRRSTDGGDTWRGYLGTATSASCSNGTTTSESPPCALPLAGNRRAR